MPETNDDEFTFTIEDNEYIIKKNESSKIKQHRNLIHGPSIVIGVSITAVCVLGIFFALNIATSEDQQLIEIQISEEKAKLEPTSVSYDVFFNNGSPMLGSPDASITLIEFGDYQCHFCNIYFQNTQHKIFENFVATGKVKIMFKDFTIIGPDSISAAHAAHCASDQDKYWQYHNVLYSNWAGENNGWAAPENLVKYANDIELDLDLFLECMSSNRHQNIIDQSNNDAKTLGITGTPAFFIVDHKNGEVETIGGAQPYEVFERLFNSKLEK